MTGWTSGPPEHDDAAYCHGEVDIPEDLRFEFERAEYEAQVRALTDIPVVDHTAS